MSDSRRLGVLIYGVSNCLAAVVMFGVVAKGGPLIAAPIIAGSSLQAYFVGISLGVLMLMRFPEIAWLFTLFASAALCTLALLLPAPVPGANGIVAFFMLALGFGALFASKSLRTKHVAAYRMIPWIDVPYHTAAVVATLALPRLAIPFETLLFVGCFLLLSAVMMDFCAATLLRRAAPAPQESRNNLAPPAGNPVRFAIALILLTAGIQGGMMSFIPQLPFGMPAGKFLSTDVLAASYMGAALGAFACELIRPKISLGSMVIVETKQGVRMPAFVMVSSASACLVVAFIAGSHGLAAITIVMTICSIFSFQIIVIPLLHEIADLTPKTPFFQYCYCAMGFAVFLSTAMIPTAGPTAILILFTALTSAFALIALRNA